MREYREFCQETRCVHYNFVRQMESIEEPTENDKRELGIALVQCQQNCQRTAHDFYEWLKERETIKSPSS